VNLWIELAFKAIEFLAGFIVRRVFRKDETKPSSSPADEAGPLRIGPRGVPTQRSEIYIPRGIEEALLAVLQKPGAAVGIIGHGGVGKTHMAGYLARQLEEKGVVSKIYWVVLKDRDITAILHDYAAQVGFDAKTLTKDQILSEINGRLNDQCRQEKVLVILDDVRPQHQAWLPQLLPPQSCRALVTSQVRTLSLPYIQELDVMTEKQARDLLQQILGETILANEAEAVDILLQRTYRHPLALDVAARQIKKFFNNGYTHPVKTFLQELDEQGLEAFKADQAVKAVLRTSHDMLDAALARAFRWLGVFSPIGFTVNEAAGLWKVPLKQARTRLKGLEGLSLARLAPPHQARIDLPEIPRYTLHDLLHTLAVELLDEFDELEQAYTALAEYYLQAFTQHRRANPEKAPHLAHAFEHLQRLAEWAASRNDATLLAKIALAPYEWLKGVYHRWDVWRIWLETALKIGLSDPLLRAQVLKTLGEVYQFQDELDTAMQYYEQALQAFQQIGNSQGEASALKDIGEVYREKAQYDKAMAHFRRAFDIFKALEDNKNQAHILRAMGHILRYQSHFQEAIKHYHQALARFEDSEDLRGQAYTYRALGHVFRQRGELAQAESYYEKALEIFQKLGDVLGQASLNLALGQIARARANMTDAYEHDQAALDLFEQIGDKHGQAKTLRELGHVLRHQGKIEQAVEVYQKALQIFEQIQNVFGQANTYLALAEVFRDQGDLAKAQDLAARALELFQQNKDLRGQAYTALTLGHIARERGEYQQAKAQYQTAYTYFQKVEDQRGQAKSLLALGHLAREQGHLTEAKKHYQKALTIFHNLNDKQGQTDVLAAQSYVALAEGNLARAKALFSQAIQGYHNLQAQNHIANAYFEFGKLLHSLDYPPKEARRYLSEAARRYEQMHLPTRAERASQIAPGRVAWLTGLFARLRSKGSRPK